jgi:hypothetical protein
VKPITPKLIARLQQIINGEIIAFLAIPLSATLMSRGVAFNMMSWQTGEAATGLTFFVFAFKYIKEAIDWQEDE